MAINALRVVLALGEKPRLGAPGIEAGNKVIGGHEGNARVGNNMTMIAAGSFRLPGRLGSRRQCSPQ
jgi:hypothetical protein